MSWWGKVVGGTFGFMMGGPLGALLGAALGNYFDTGLDGINLDDSLGLGATERVQSVFFTTTFAVMGYIAKSDGRVTKDEIALADQVMRRMNLNERQRTVAINLFNEGKKPWSPIGPDADKRPKEGTPEGEEYATRHIKPGPERERELKRRKEARENKLKEEGAFGGPGGNFDKEGWGEETSDDPDDAAFGKASNRYEVESVLGDAIEQHEAERGVPYQLFDDDRHAGK